MNATETATAIIAESNELRTTFYVGLASFTVLVWDHLVTLPDEIEYIWKRQKGPLIWLFFINRYLTPLGFIVNLIAYLSDLFTPEVNVRSMTVIGINTTALMMLLRVYAMYEKRKSIVLFVGLIFCVEFGTNAWLLTHGVAVRHTAGIHACTMIFDSDRVKGAIASASAWLPLIYDTIVLALTLWRAHPGKHRVTVGRIMRIMVKEGLLYYSVIFTITFILTLMIVSAPDGLKNITAQTEYLMTVAMMSRITLHLKKQMHDGWDSYGLFGTTTTDVASPYLTGNNRYGTRGTRGTDGVDITIQEYSIVHDDQGDIVPLPQSPPRAKVPHGRDEWHELGPVRINMHSDEDDRSNTPRKP
ncbi:hypothetical protein L227DRAFT_609683 [Lentinus tigrinus ALCF2SS1-6]|uniref:DUF6533 domain-containing protein n=1 Tax=Lentinus tigrinus ALCF2SS1-6 TaxID=1328759 RepID=A0A5C2SFS3_9APHY|nr:hypothetical protein L227DRAFT_609683 [Lentinus tigrinus ALCF2SS1-6]